MNQYIKMIVFVIVLGTFTSVMLLGVDALTESYIEANREAKLRSTVLNAFDVSHTRGTINDLFFDRVVEETIDGLTFYYYESTGAVAFMVEGNGVWGPIKAIVAVDAGFERILYIDILEQEETPGLGGRIVERQYLDTFNDVPFQDNNPYIEINRVSDPDNPSDIDAIAGATRTSKAFESILNNAYEEYRTAWLSREV